SPQHLRWMFTTFHLGPYQPLSWVTLGLDYVLWGMQPAGYHVTSILLHSAAAALLAAVVFQLARVGRLTAVLIALLWSLHPLRVEAVSWITERREVLCGALSLLAIWLDLRGGRPIWVWVAGGAAMLAKGTAMMLPVI